MSTRSTRPTDISVDGSASDSDPAIEFDYDPTHAESAVTTAPHDLTAFARIMAEDPALVYREGQEDTLRALQEVLAKATLPMTGAEILLATQALMTKL